MRIHESHHETGSQVAMLYGVLLGCCFGYGGSYGLFHIHFHFRDEKKNTSLLFSLVLLDIKVLCWYILINEMFFFCFFFQVKDHIFPISKIKLIDFYRPWQTSPPDTQSKKGNDEVVVVPLYSKETHQKIIKRHGSLKRLKLRKRLSRRPTPL